MFLLFPFQHLLKVTFHMSVFKRNIRVSEFKQIQLCYKASPSCKRQREVCTYLITYLVTYFLTPWSRVHVEKLTGLQLVKKFPAFYGTRKFIVAFTIIRNLSLS
jgi:hypothetical protein